VEIPDAAVISTIVVLAGAVVGTWKVYSRREARIIGAIKTEHAKELAKRDERLVKLEDRVQALEDLRLSIYREHAAALERLTLRCVDAIDGMNTTLRDNLLATRDLAKAVAQQTHALRDSPCGAGKDLPQPHPLAATDTEAISRRDGDG
jgi:hypothetical protein